MHAIPLLVPWRPVRKHDGGGKQNAPYVRLENLLLST